MNKIEFDAEQCSLRLNGINVRENDNIKMGQYHTLEIELNRPFTIIKENWDSIHMEQIQDLCDPIKKSEVAALVMQEGLANLCLIKNTVTRTCARIERNLPKKKHVTMKTFIYYFFFIEIYFFREIIFMKRPLKDFLMIFITLLCCILTSMSLKYY